MEGIHNLKPNRVIKAFERAGWVVRKQTGSSHVVLKKEGNPNLLTVPVHKSKPIKKGLLLAQIKTAGLTIEEFLELYK
jgi:predicted RNA binding protein YcfA (HicA-like mRNA interferase family)